MQSKILAESYTSEVSSSSLNVDSDGNNGIEDFSNKLSKNDEKSSEPEYEPSTLIQKIKTKLLEYTKLSPGWDGYSGIPLPSKNVKIMVGAIEKVILHQIPMPSVVPGGDGAVQIEWHVNDFDLEFTVSSFGELSVWRYDIRSESESEMLLDEMDKEKFFLTLTQWISDLSRISKFPNQV